MKKPLRTAIMVAAMLLTLPSCNPNEYAPEIGDQVFYLDENSAFGTPVGTVEAVDLDEGQKISFIVVSGNTEGAFEIDPILGTMIVNNPSVLDYEKTPRFDLEVEVSDQHSDNPMSNTAIITVFLNNLNEHAPEMEDQYFSVEEKTPSGSLIGTITATDADQGQFLSYHIIEGNANASVFLDSLSGELRVADSSYFNFEKNKELNLVIQASDSDSIRSLSCTASVQIQILEVKEVFADFNGYAQKGPFVLGSQLTIHELDSGLVSTGRVFSTEITDNSGYFELQGIELESPYVKINVNGFYFNEISGALSEAQLDLNATMDIRTAAMQNINILSHLEESRVHTLMNQGYGFAESKEMARAEALSIFEFTSLEGTPSEAMDIAQSGEDNAMLLAASIILQGKRSTAEFSELLNQVRLDFSENGQLDNEALGTLLVDDAVRLDLQIIRTQIESRYSDLGQPYSVPPFEKYIALFLDNTSFEASSPEDFVTFPTEGIYGLNALHPDVSQVENHFLNDLNYSFAVDVTGTHIFKVKVTGWGCLYRWGSLVNMTNYAETEPVRFAEYTTTSNGHCDGDISFHVDQEESNILTMEYFLDGSSEPFLTRQLEIMDTTVPVDSTSAR